MFFVYLLFTTLPGGQCYISSSYSRGVDIRTIFEIRVRFLFSSNNITSLAQLDSFLFFLLVRFKFLSLWNRSIFWFTCGFHIIHYHIQSHCFIFDRWIMYAPITVITNTNVTFYPLKVTLLLRLSTTFPAIR